MMSTEAVCMTNLHGRLLGANERFCKLFGLQMDEVPWRYFLDLHRNADDWNLLRRGLEQASKVHLLQLRLRHRKGRSFPCEVQAECVEVENGIAVKMTIQRLENTTSEEFKMAKPDSNLHHTLVYLTACDACGKVKDAKSEWVTPIRPVAKTKHRKPCYCPSCSVALFPDIIEAQAVAH